LSVEEQLENFRLYLKREEVKDSSIYQYCSTVKEFLTFLDGKKPTEKLVTGFQDVIGKRLKLRSFQFKKIILRRYLESINRHDLTRLVKVKGVKPSLSRYVTEEQKDAMVKAAVDPRDKAIIEVSFAACLRREEIVNFQVEDILRDRMRLRIEGKGRGEEGKIRYPPISPRALNAIDRYLTAEGITWGKVFPVSDDVVYNVVEKYGKEAGVPFHVHPHLLRHGGAKHLRRKGMPLEVLKEILGHESYDTTLIYGSVDDDEIDKHYRGAHGK